MLILSQSLVVSRIIRISFKFERFHTKQNKFFTSDSEMNISYPSNMTIDALSLATNSFLEIPRILQNTTQTSLPGYVDTIGTIISFLSLIGSLFTLLTFIILKNVQKNKFFFLVFNIAFADLITAIGGLIEIGGSITNFECILTALFRDFGIICSYFFTTCIAAVIYYAARRELDDDSVQRKIRLTIYLAYIFALMGIIFPGVTGSYCNSGNACWVAPGFSWDMVWFLTEFMFPSLFVFIVTVILFVKTTKTIEEENKWALVPNKSYKLLFWIPFIFLICNLPGTLFTIFCFNAQSFTFLRYINAFARDAQGLFHTLLYSIGIVGEALHERLNEAWNNRRKKRDNLKRHPGEVMLIEDQKGVLIY